MDGRPKAIVDEKLDNILFQTGCRKERKEHSRIKY